MQPRLEAFFSFKILREIFWGAEGEGLGNTHPSRGEGVPKKSQKKLRNYDSYLHEIEASRYYCYLGPLKR